MQGAIRCVLLDLDGTLVDTAPDMAFALNQTLSRHDREPLPQAVIRSSVSLGGAALVKLAFNMVESDPDFTRIRDEFLAIYRANLCRHSRLFPGMEQVLARLELSSIPWGIVTNKPAWLTNPLTQALQLDTRSRLHRLRRYAGTTQTAPRPAAPCLQTVAPQRTGNRVCR